MTYRKFLLALLATAFLLRFAAVLALRDWHEPPQRRTTGADGVEYNSLALQLAQGNGYVWDSGQPTSFRAPGFPFLLSTVYFLVGTSYPLVYILFCLLGTLSSFVTYLIAREMVSEQMARISAFLAAVYPPGIYFATRFDSENLFIPFLGLGIWLFLRYLKTGSAGVLSLAALLLGFGALTRAFALLFLPILAMILIAQQVRRRRLSFSPLFLLISGFVLVIFPWTARNYRVHGRPVLIATNGGSTFYGGNNDLVVKEVSHWGGWVATNYLPGRDLIDATPDEVAHDALEWQLGLGWVKQHLQSVPFLCLMKFLRLWLPDIDSANRTYVIAQVIGYAPYLALFLIGAAQCFGTRRYWSITWAVIHATLLTTVATALIFWGNTRFRDANYPFIMLYAAVGVHGLVARLGRVALPFSLTSPAPLRSVPS